MIKNLEKFESQNANGLQNTYQKVVMNEYSPNEGTAKSSEILYIYREV